MADRVMRHVGWWTVLAAAVSLARPAHAIEEKGRGEPSVVAAIDAILADPAFRGGFQGLCVESLSSGKMLYERNADLLFMPASNQKLLTSAAVLDALGPDWTFTTTLIRTGNLGDDGTLRGNLYLKGSGDPLLEPKHLDLFAESVKAAGIRKVQGKLVGDASRFDREQLGTGWQADYLAAYYAAPVSGLTFNKNVLAVDVDPGRSPGDPLRCTVSPPGSRAKIVVRGRTDEKDRSPALVVDRELGREEIVIGGTLPVGAKAEAHRPVDVTVTNPTRFATAYLMNRLRALSIDVAGGDDEGVTPSNGTVEIARHTSEPLSEILKRMNKPSDNLIAECLIKALGAEKSKDGVGSWRNGTAAAQEWFKTIGIDPLGVVMADGSGLSRHNFVTPHSYARMLKAMAGHRYARIFKESLPAPGEPGTFRNRPIGPNAGKTARVKSGYIGAVSSLSGYVEARNGEQMLFVIFMNNHQCPNAVARAAQDRIVEFLASRE